MASNSRFNVKYIYDLPYTERTQLCIVLDQNDKWKELGGIHMQYSVMEIHDLSREFLRHNSPTDELLTKWGHRNHTVTELFVLLSRMRHYQAMRILKQFVDPKYHRLLNEGEENLSAFTCTQGPTSNKETIPALGVSNSKPTNERTRNEAGMTAIPGPSKIDNNQTLNKEMDYGQHNLNVTKTAVAHLAVNKVALPPEPVDEQKIINVAENKENSNPESNLQPRKLSNASDAGAMAESCGTIPHIAYKELVAATQGWDTQTILGKGGFGTVFKGTWKNTQVAIKRIEQRGAESAESYQGQMEQSLRELRILNSCRHDNILPLYGFSVGGDEPCLVYQFMPNGSLEDRILCRKGSRPLTWLQRHNIAEGTARGLQFLHNNHKPFIHGDVKSANILLDANMEARIGDFGLARDGPLTQYTHMTVSRVHGTLPYLPDEFLRNKKLSTKVDTFSYGIVLYELTTGLRAYDENRPKKFLKDLIESCEEGLWPSLLDKKAGTDDPHGYLYLVKLGTCCASQKAKERPEMEIVLKQLEGVTAKRSMAIRAQDVMRQKSPSPSTPYEIQVFHDRQSQLRQQQQQSPGISLQPPSFGVGANNGGANNGGANNGGANIGGANIGGANNGGANNGAANNGAANNGPAVEWQELHNVKRHNNPFLVYTPPPELQHHGSDRPLGLAVDNGFRLSPVQSPQGLPSHGLPPHGLPLPVISLSPASGSDRGSTTGSDEENSLPVSVNVDAPPPQDLNGTCEIVPLLSMLGMNEGVGDSGLRSTPSLEIMERSNYSSSEVRSVSSMYKSQPTATGKVFTLD